MWACAQESGFWSLFPALVGSHRWPGGSPHGCGFTTFTGLLVHRSRQTSRTEPLAYADSTDYHAQVGFNEFVVRYR